MLYMAHPTGSAITYRTIPFSTRTSKDRHIQGIQQPLLLTETEAQINKDTGSSPEMLCSHRAMMDDVYEIQRRLGEKALVDRVLVKKGPTSVLGL